MITIRQDNEKSRPGIKKLLPYVVILLLIMRIRYIFEHKTEPLAFIATVFGIVLLLLIFAILFVIFRDRKLSVLLLSIKDPDMRIQKMEELYRQGQWKNKGSYLNSLSTAYYEKGDCEKALALVQEAIATQTKGILFIRIGSNPTILEVWQMNEITCLIACHKIAEAEEALIQINTNRRKDPISSSNIHACWAQIYIKKGRVQEAREHLRQLVALPLPTDEQQKKNVQCHHWLMQAECDLLEDDAKSAYAKLDDVIAHCTWPPTVKQAKELIEQL